VHIGTIVLLLEEKVKNYTSLHFFIFFTRSGAF
jgi:hypothetical protein